MKKTVASLFLLALPLAVTAQKYEFQEVTSIPCQPVISQDKTGTCWSFSTTSFLEAEILRQSGQRVDLSEMYNVRKTYDDKAYNYVMRQGKAQFSEGGLSHDVINSARRYGVVPQQVFSGYVTENRKYDHEKLAGQLEEVLKKYATSKKLSPEWKAETAVLLDAGIGSPVTSFSYEGTEYTPESYLASLKLDLDEYVTITSFTHEKPYAEFVLNIPDNFSNGRFYNLPLDEYIANIDHALENGYTLALDADVSEAFFFGKAGIAVVPEGTDVRSAAAEIRPEMKVTADYRQHEFENFNTTDDHLMHIVGKVKDQKGNVYYKVKNSWGADAGQHGFVYMSVPYMKLKSISVLVSKDGLMKKTRKSLAI